MAEEEPSLFDVTSEEAAPTREEMLFNLLDIYVLVPFRIMWDDIRARIGVVILLLYLFMGTVLLPIMPEPTTAQGPPLLGWFQSMELPLILGTTNTGKGILASITYATPFMFKMMIAGAVFASVVAMVVGLLTGYSGGSLDRVLTTLTDIVMALPGLPLFMVLATFLQPTNPFVVGIILSINRWAGLARQVRSEVLSIKTESYVEASQAIGMSTPHILLSDVLPNVMPFLLMRMVTMARAIIFASVALFFLGILPSSGENWGVMLQQAYNQGNALTSASAYHWLFVPIVVIGVISFGLTLLAQSADQLFNPRVRARHASATAETTEHE